MEVNRSPIPTTQSLVKPRSFDMDIVLSNQCSTAKPWSCSLYPSIWFPKQPIPRTQSLIKPPSSSSLIWFPMVSYTYQYLVKPRSCSLYLSVWFGTQWIPTNPCLVKSGSLGTLRVLLSRIWRRQTLHMYSDESVSIYSSGGPQPTKYRRWPASGQCSRSSGSAMEHVNHLVIRFPLESRTQRYWKY